MKAHNYSPEDILRKAEEFRTGNIHEAAIRYFSGNMSAAESKAFDAVMVQNPDLQEEVQLQGFALRSARVAGREPVREKLAKASARARQREQRRSRQRAVRTAARIATPALAACLILAVMLGWGGQDAAPQAVHIADVNSFGVMHSPDSPGGVRQATLFRLVGEEVAFLKVPGSFRIKPIAMDLQIGLPWNSGDLEVQFLLSSQRKNTSLRWALCEEMRSLGLPVRDPIRLQNQRWEVASTLQLAEMDKSGFAMNYAPLTGFLAEEDPDLNESTLTLPSQRAEFAGQVARSALSPTDMNGRLWESYKFDV